MIVHSSFHFHSLTDNGKKDCFSSISIREFAKSINRDPGIVPGRLESDGIVGKDDASMNSLRHKYRVKVFYKEHRIQ